MPAWSARNSNVMVCFAGDALGDAIGVDGEAAGLLVARERDAHEVVLRDLDAVGLELALVGDDGDVAAVGRLILAAGCRARRRTQHGERGERLRPGPS